MAYQKLFRTKYVDQLIDQVNQGINLESFYGSRFNYDKSQVLSVPEIYQPQGLLYEMKPEDNLSSAIALFKAYPRISALQAADSRLWIYLSIADLFPYVRKKWAAQQPAANDPDRMEKMISNIRIHWFGLQKDSSTFNPMRHALANLWWSVYISVDRNAKIFEDKYKYTRLLFKNETFRTRTATGFLGRNREALYGILDFMEQCPEVSGGNKETAFTEITKFLNYLGGSIQLSFMKRDFFLSQLLNNRDMLLSRIEGRTKIVTDESNSYSIPDEEIQNSAMVQEPGYTNYINVRETASSMINKPFFK
ncbi:MAG: hypothetical protein HDS50_00015 [Bacteroides sp.]|nr:hypothetical protein [Bacteroides sp.]